MHGSQRHVQEPSSRSEQKRQGQARQHEKMRNAALPGITHFPAPDEEIEGEVVNPAGQQQPRIAEQHRDVRQGREPAGAAVPHRRNDGRVERRKQCRDRHPGNHFRDPAAPGQRREQHPGDQGDRVDDRKELIRCHG